MRGKNLHDCRGVARMRDVLVVGRERLGRELAQHLREREVDRRRVVLRVVHLGVGFRVQGSGFRVQGSGFRVQGSGFVLRVVHLVQGG